MQKAILEKQLLALHKMYIDSARIYAPFTSLIQSSGTGKSKLCVEILSNYPGIYSVFRKQGESTGIPSAASWMKDMFNYVIKANEDELPFNAQQLSACQAIKFTPTKFLIALHAMIVAYYKFFQRAYEENNNSRDLALKQIGIYFQITPIETQTNPLFNPHFPETDLRNVSEVLSDISCLLNGEVSEQKAKMYGLNLNIINVIMKPDIYSNFPFLLFLDEADYLNELTACGRLPGVHIVRRALHLLGADIRLLTVAIGTNPDVVDFTPYDNSLRYVTRKELLPPITLSCNWEIFSNEYPLEDLEMTRERLQSGNNRFITSDGVRVVREIVYHTPSVFDGIDPFYQKIVQKSVLNGMFSNYYLCNPFLTKMRGIEPIQDPMNKYFEKFNWVSLASSHERISTGDIRRKFPQISLNNSAFDDDDDCDDDDDDCDYYDGDDDEE